MGLILSSFEQFDLLLTNMFDNDIDITSDMFVLVGHRFMVVRVDEYNLLKSHYK